MCPQISDLATKEPEERGLNLNEQEWDALIMLFEDRAYNGGTEGPFEGGKLPDSLFNKVMERTSYEYDEYDWIQFDDLPKAVPENWKPWCFITASSKAAHHHECGAYQSGLGCKSCPFDGVIYPW
jgi:hypothetical protein